MMTLIQYKQCMFMQKTHCNEWNKFMLSRLSGQEFIIPAIDGKKDVSTNLAKVQFSDKPE